MTEDWSEDELFILRVRLNNQCQFSNNECKSPSIQEGVPPLPRDKAEFLSSLPTDRTITHVSSPNPYNHHDIETWELDLDWTED